MHFKVLWTVKRYKNCCVNYLSAYSILRVRPIFLEKNLARNPGSFAGHKAINSAQLHSAAPGDERVDRDNFRLPRENMRLLLQLLIEQRLAPRSALKETQF